MRRQAVHVSRVALAPHFISRFPLRSFVFQVCCVCGRSESERKKELLSLGVRRRRCRLLLILGACVSRRRGLCSARRLNDNKSDLRPAPRLRKFGVRQICLGRLAPAFLVRAVIEPAWRRLARLYLARGSRGLCVLGFFALTGQSSLSSRSSSSTAAAFSP